MLTEAQRERRKHGIGGSDIAVIMGLSPYKTPLQLYYEKTGLIEIEYKKTEEQYWGHLMEPVIRDHFCRLHGLTVSQHDTLVHKDYDFIIGNIDGYITALDSILEIKITNAFKRNEWGIEGTDVLPIIYLLQAAHYCAVKNCNKAIVAVLIGGNEYREYNYTRDLEIENEIIKACIEFWDCVKERREPEACTINDLRIKYSRNDPEKTIQYNVEINQEIQPLYDVKQQIKRLTEIEEQHKFNLMNIMKDADCIIDESGKTIITWRANKNGQRVFRLAGI